MTFDRFVKDHGANVIAFASLLALGYQIRSSNQQFRTQIAESKEQFQTQIAETKEQFRVLNQGYLNAMPRLDPARDGATSVIQVPFGGEKVVAANLSVDALNPVVNLENLGNLPLKYRIVKFDVWLNDQLRTSPLAATDNVNGVLYPKVQGNYFARPGIRLDVRGPIPFGQLQKLTAKIHIQISYGTSKDDESMFDRESSFRWLGNGGNNVFTAIRDKW